MATTRPKHSSMTASPSRSAAQYTFNPSEWQEEMEYLPAAPKHQSHAMDKSSPAWMDFSRDGIPGIASMSTLSATSSLGFTHDRHTGNGASSKRNQRLQQREEDSLSNDRLPDEEERRTAAPKLQYPSQHGKSIHKKELGHGHGQEMMGNLKQMKTRLEDEKAKLKRDLELMQNQLCPGDNAGPTKTNNTDTRESDAVTVSTASTSGTTYIAETLGESITKSLHDQAEDLRRALGETQEATPKEETKKKEELSKTVPTTTTTTPKEESKKKEEPSKTVPSTTTTGIELQELQKALAVCQSSLEPSTHQQQTTMPSSPQCEVNSSPKQEKTDSTAALSSAKAKPSLDSLQAKKTTLKFDLAALSRKSKSARGELMALAKELKFDLPAGGNIQSLATAANLQDLPVDKQTLKRIEDLLRKVQEHERTIRELKEEKRRLGKECDEMKAQAKEHRETVTCLATHLEETSNREAVLRKELEEAKSKNHSVKNNIAGADKRVKEAEEKLMKYSKELEASGVLIGVLGVKLENQNRLIQNLNAKQENLSLERDTMKRQVEEQTITVDTLESQLEEAGSRECFLRKELANAKEQAESARQAMDNVVPPERVQHLEAMVAQYKEESLEAREEINVLMEENNELRGINCEVGERIMNQAEQHQQIVARLEAQLREVKDQEQSVRQELDELRAVAENARATVDTHRQELRELRNAKVSGNNDQLQREQALEMALEESQLEANSAKEDLVEALTRIRMLEDELMELQDYFFDGGSDDDESMASHESVDMEDELPWSIWYLLSCA